MRLIVIDGGFSTDHGHHYAMNDFICSEGKQRGYRGLVIGPKLYANGIRRKIFRKPGFLHRPVLRTSDYDVPLEPDEDNQDFFLYKTFQFASYNMSVQQDLESAIPVERLSDGDMIVVHTAFLTSIIGIARWLKNNTTKRLKVRIVFRFPPWIYQVNRQLAELCFVEAMRCWEQIQADVVLFTDIDEYTSYIRNRTSLPVYTTPMGLDFYDDIGLTAPKGTEETGYTFVAAGIPHKAKGSDLLPQAIHRHLETFPKDRFILQENPQRRYENFYEPTQIDLCPNVRIIRESLETKDFHMLLTQADILLNPYNPLHYEYRSSHIFIEGLGLNRVVIGGKLHWTQEWMEKVGNVGAILQEHTVDELVRVMSQVRSNIELHRSAVAAVAQKIRLENNGTRWLDFVLNPPNSDQ